LEQPPNEDANLLPQLQQLESTLSGCAKEASKDQVFMRMGYMASELKRLASKVHKNEQRTSFLQVSKRWPGSSWGFPPPPCCFFVHQAPHVHPKVDTHLHARAWWEVGGQASSWGGPRSSHAAGVHPQTLCETLHSENKELRTKLERDLEQRNQALEKLR